MILALSPHLDDVIFSAGGYLYQQARARTRVQCLTVFTSSVPNPTGFALECQLDKGLTADVDYMALRRAEDAAACAHLGLTHEHWDYREAPHRGYESAPELFTGIRSSDPLPASELVKRITEHIDRVGADEVLYPHGAGDHVDHQQVIRAVIELKAGFPGVTFREYYDMPYANKFASRYPELGNTVPPLELPTETLRKKIEACNKYETQIGYQFGGATETRRRLGNKEWLTNQQ